jgi:hypothetical protein
MPLLRRVAGAAEYSAVFSNKLSVYAPPHVSVTDLSGQADAHREASRRVVLEAPLDMLMPQ